MDSHQADICRRLERDLTSTLGDAHASRVLEAASSAVLLQGADFQAKVVGDVQQQIHDLRICTTWPTCKQHGSHPLWLHDDYWVCETLSARVARFGELPASRPHRDA